MPARFKSSKAMLAWAAQRARQLDVVIAALVRQPRVLARQSRILKARSLLSLHEVAKNLT